MLPIMKKYIRKTFGQNLVAKRQIERLKILITTVNKTFFTVLRTHLTILPITRICARKYACHLTGSMFLFFSFIEFTLKKVLRVFPLANVHDR